MLEFKYESHDYYLVGYNGKKEMVVFKPSRTTNKIFSINNKCSADDLRQIADKLDELNKK